MISSILLPQSKVGKHGTYNVKFLFYFFFHMKVAVDEN